MTGGAPRRLKRTDRRIKATWSYHARLVEVLAGAGRKFRCGSLLPVEQAGPPRCLDGFPPTVEASLKLGSGTGRLAMPVAYVSAQGADLHECPLGPPTHA